MELKKDFLDRMKNILHDEYDEFLASYNLPAYHGLRINTLKTNYDKLSKICDYLTTPIPWSIDGYYYQGQAGKSILHEAGCYYIQEPSAMSPITQMGIREGDIVLDLCAAPGGKSTYIASLLNNTGVLFSNEIVATRAKILSSNIERMGIKNAIVTNESPLKLSQIFVNYFDKILVDAPCSGEGMFRKDPNAILEWSVDNVKMCADRSYDILEKAFAMLKVGGTLTYSTCTFSLDENEMNIIRFLDNHPNSQIVEPKMFDGFCKGVDVDNSGRGSLCIRLYPHKIKGEGHFVATIKKLDDENTTFRPNQKMKADKSAISAFKEFAKRFDINYTPYFYSFGKELYNLPIDINLDKIKVVRAGLHLGTFDKYFEPSHSLAMALNITDNTPHIDLNEDQAKQYIAGNILSVDNLQNGWYVISFQNISLGWGKVVNEIIKNHYPKGLRKQL